MDLSSLVYKLYMIWGFSLLWTVLREWEIKHANLSSVHSGHFRLSKKNPIHLLGLCGLSLQRKPGENIGTDCHKYRSFNCKAYPFCKDNSAGQEHQGCVSLSTMMKAILTFGSLLGLCTFGLVKLSSMEETSVFSSVFGASTLATPSNLCDLVSEGAKVEVTVDPLSFCSSVPLTASPFTLIFPST